jgi:hypothetical protein
VPPCVVEVPILVKVLLLPVPVPLIVILEILPKAGKKKKAELPVAPPGVYPKQLAPDTIVTVPDEPPLSLK